MKQTHSASVRLIKQIAEACGAARPTKVNTDCQIIAAHYGSRLNNAKATKAEKLLEGMGFVRAALRSTGSSTFGDFSSDVYGSEYTHPNSAWACVYACFANKPCFVIDVRITEEQLAEISKNR